MTATPIAHPPETLEGWYALHQIFRIDRKNLDARGEALKRMGEAAITALSTDKPGWSSFVRLIGSTSDLLVIHFRESLDAIGEAQNVLADCELAAVLQPSYSFLSVTEAGLYHITAELARSAGERGGVVGDDPYRKDLATRVDAERESAHVTRRLYPDLPAEMPYVSFYPMSKRRSERQNWYALSLDERSALMHSHGTTGRRYAGRVQQVITGAIGFSAWEWGVTLFAADPLEFKKLVTDMRFDEVSAKYADFGEFYVGKILPPREWLSAPEVSSLVERIGSLR
ncbi:MAG: heme-dependent peroxidase [Gemmatimonadaceae bacterium]|nr:heme-dependent peroxidase [Gemmatimonadaceae bacterium]